jgi:hypothetical protein
MLTGDALVAWIKGASTQKPHAALKLRQSVDLKSAA